MNDRRRNTIAKLDRLLAKQQNEKETLLKKTKELEAVIASGSQKAVELKNKLDILLTKKQARIDILLAEIEALKKENIQLFTRQTVDLSEKKPDWYIAPHKDVTAEITKPVDVNILSQPKIKEPAPTWLVLFLDNLLTGITNIFAAFWKAGLTVRHQAEDKKIPQYVYLIDPDTGKPTRLNITLVGQHGGGGVMGGVGGGSSDDADPLAPYKVNDVDDASTVKYYGFADADGAWYILKEDTSVVPKTYRYARGASAYSTAWTNRASQTYDYYSVIF